MWDQGTWQGKEKTKERKRESNYLDLLRAIRSAERKHKVDLTDAKAIVKAIIKGSRLLSQCFEGRHRETRKALKWGKQGPEPRSEMREWAFENGEFVIKKNTGKPWPDHLDPETCIKPLQNNEKPTQVTPPDFNSIKKHLTNDLWLLSDDTHENPLDTIVRKNFERQRTMDDQIRQNVPRILDEGKDTPDEPPTSPTHDQTETNPPDRTEPDRQTNTRTDPEDPGI
jgi:hypothetical protein